MTDPLIWNKISELESTVRMLEQSLAEGCLDGEFVRLRDELKAAERERDAAIKELIDDANQYEKRIASLEDENAKLREAIESQIADRCRLNMENQRLREACQATLDACDDKASVRLPLAVWQKISAALQKKDGGND